jgi:hypothetical protein
LSRRGFLAAGGGLAVVAAGLGAGTALWPSGKAEPRDEVAIETLPPEVAVHYRFARAQPELLAALACYCGCGPTVAHRNLHDCFVNRSGGWADHASGCRVCQDEARIAAEMLAQGEKLPAIRARIDAEFAGLGTPTKG